MHESTFLASRLRGATFRSCHIADSSAPSMVATRNGRSAERDWKVGGCGRARGVRRGGREAGNGD
eukprot:6180335-Pleurochrysis_carterae.AAC.1